MAITKVSASLVDLDGGVVINESSADADFRVESNGKTHMLFVDGGNDRVGVGAAPSSPFSVSAADGTLANFTNASDADFQFKTASAVALLTPSTGTLAFGTSDTERMRIDSSGNVGIGMTPTHQLSVFGFDTATSINTGSVSSLPDTLGLFVSSTAHTQTAYGDLNIKARTDAGGFYGIGFFTASSNNTPALRMKIDSSGKVGIGTSPSSLFHVNAADGVADNDFVATITNAEATDGRSFGLGINAGSNGSDFALNINTHDAGANLMRLKGSGDCHFPNASAFGIGTDSAATLIHAKAASGDAELRLEAATNSDARVRFGDATDNDLGYIGFNRNSGYMNFSINNTQGEHMRINSSGVLMVNTTGAIGPGMIAVKSAASSTGCLGLQNTSNGGSFVRFANAANNAVIGTITNNGDTGTAYNTSSDYRLKENVTDMTDATTRLKQLKPKRFNFKSDETNTLVDGFLAHEVSGIVPEAITGEKDAVDSEGNPEYQGIDQSKLVPLLVKTIQELEARITTLEG
tara:strand:- start:777 stop:2336 length:1560 start_codon:yes stop_codon:yes gene_type:complete